MDLLILFSWAFNSLLEFQMATNKWRMDLPGLDTCMIYIMMPVKLFMVPIHASLGVSVCGASLSTNPTLTTNSPEGLFL